MSIDRVCTSGLRLESFYNLMVKDVIATEENPEDNKMPTFMEKRRAVIELSQKFTQGNTYYTAYLRKSILTLILAIGLLVYLFARGLSVSYEVTFETCSCEIK